MSAPGSMDIVAWASELRGVMAVLNDRPTFVAVGDLRRLLARQPTHHLGGDWMAAVGHARFWLDWAERGLPPMALMAPADPPLVPAAPKAWEYADV